MDFSFLHDNKEYTVILSEFIEGETKGDIFEFSYSDEEHNRIKHGIEVFVNKNNSLLPMRVRDLPNEVKDIISTNIDEILRGTFVANPYFDELLVFFGNQVFTYQEHFKPINCNQCDRKNLFEMRNKGGENKTNYINEIIRLIGEDKNPEWPFREKLVIQFSISDIQSRLDEIDLDNLAKTMFDIFKGLIYVNDSQITSFAGDKNVLNNFKAFIVAIRRLESNEKPRFQEFLYSSRLNAWQDERNKRSELNKSTRFRAYNSLKSEQK